MAEHIQEFGIKELWSIGYGDTNLQIDYPDGTMKTLTVTNNGDFRVGESLEALKRCDIVVGNPPFSQNLGKDYFRLAIENGKDIIGIEMPEKTTYGYLKTAVLTKKLTVYTCPFEDFDVPMLKDRSRARWDTAEEYASNKVQTYIFSTFSDAHDLKLKLEPKFKLADSLMARWSDLPDVPTGSRDKISKVDTKVLIYKDKLNKNGDATYSHMNWVPRKPKNDGISAPQIAISPYEILGYNWERYFDIVDVIHVNGDLVDPNSSQILKTMHGTPLIRFKYK